MIGTYDIRFTTGPFWVPLKPSKTPTKKWYLSLHGRSWRACAKCRCCQILQDVGHEETWHHLKKKNAAAAGHIIQRPTALALVHSKTRKCASSLWWAKISMQWDVAFLMPSAGSRVGFNYFWFSTVFGIMIRNEWIFLGWVSSAFSSIFLVFWLCAFCSMGCEERVPRCWCEGQFFPPMLPTCLSAGRRS